MSLGEMTQHGSDGFGGCRAIAILTAAGMVFGCLAFGATEQWSYCVLQIVAGTVGVAWCVTGRRGVRILLVCSLLAAVGLCQIISLPEGVLGRLAPFSFHARDTLRLINIDPEGWNISVDPGATIRSAAWCFSLALVVVAVASASRCGTARKIIVGAMAVIGAGTLVLGIVFVKAPVYVALGFHDMTGPLRPWKNPLPP